MNLTRIYVMTEEELADATAFLSAEIASIRLQIDRRSNPETEWLAKANYALRMKDMQQQRIAAEVSRRKRAATLSLENRFITAAREMLEVETFDEIMAVARHNI
jgi:hypothetical protein